jgi:hypothetical protein
MSADAPEEDEAVVLGAAAPLAPGSAPDDLDGHRPWGGAPPVGPALSAEDVEALERLVDALAVEEPGGDDVAPSDRVPTAELDELVWRLGGEDGPLRPLLLLAHRAAALRLERDNLRVALETNRSISAAVGILMALHQLTQDDAFDLLVRVSQNTNRKLRDVAESVVRTGVLPGDEAG